MMGDPKRGGLSQPHRAIAPADGREAFTLELFDDLWRRYRGRVPHVRAYEDVLRAAGATFVNDHVAFRTFACSRPALGLATVGRVFEALGYSPESCYVFPEKNLSAVHLRHPNERFPKIFISELKTWELEAAARRIVLRTLASHRPALPDEVLADLRSVAQAVSSKRSRLLKTLLDFFRRLPWAPPAKEDVLRLDRASQYAAWVLVHGYDVNHFTASVDSHGQGALSDIEKTVAALRRAGVPMKAEIEGAPGSKLRQSATEAAVIPVTVRSGRRTSSMDWTYAYFELAERGYVTDPESGRRERFEGFLGGQAAQLFEMTRKARGRG